ncbi:MAG: electron transport complex subunit RsxB [Burkholderiaceae bacterium]
MKGDTDMGLSDKVTPIFAALPQTQCTRCGYPDCQAYAEAIAAGEAPINQCPPGGAEGIARLSRITGQAITPLNPANGVEAPRSVVFIDENWCIGCTLCLDACPVDAIIGSNKRMHTVIEPLCTGCELCLPVCPVDCILLENVTGERTGWAAWSQQEADTALNRYTFHSEKDNKHAGEKAVSRVKKAEEKLADLASHSAHTDPVVLDNKRAVIAAALAKARAQRK